MALLLTMPTMIYGLDMARSIIQEKTSRVFEVMLATVEARRYAGRKADRRGAVGMTQIAIWLVAGAATLFHGHLRWPPRYSPANMPSTSPGLKAFSFPIYFVLGVRCSSAPFFAGLAATCETAQELQMYMPLAAVPPGSAWAMIPLIINDSNSSGAVAASLFPRPRLSSCISRMA